MFPFCDPAHCAKAGSELGFEVAETSALGAIWRRKGRSCFLQQRGDEESPEVESMKFRVWSEILFVVAVFVLATSGAWGQHPPKSTGPKYDAAHEVKVKGVIEDIREVPGEFEGTQLVVKVDTKTVIVHVAPADFLKEIETSFNKGDEVSVVGAKDPDATGDEILAREITDGSNTATLRDDKGVPIWAGWKPSKSAGQ